MAVITCDCEPFEVCPSCAPAMATGVPLPVEPQRYTLAELEQLAKQWRDELGLTSEDGAPWAVSHLLQWLQKREEGGDGQG